ncbi:MAG TPA: hypothetical protein VFK09_11365 [Gemmatimonadales bacterium]|nr:hypothetical protein [Gemmatimonadales bacterium]
MTTWHLWLDQNPRPGFLNMAIDSALLELAEGDGVGFLRLYRWEPACLSFGRHEPALRRYRRERIEALGLDVVRRPTGGRAVWHAAELTYAVAAPSGALGPLAASHRAVHEMLAAALRRLGVEVGLAPRAPAVAVSGGACFATAAGGELISGGRKLAGSAQLRARAAFLQHGSVLLAGDQSLVAAVSAGACNEVAAGAQAAVRSRARARPQPAPRPETTLAEVLGRAVGFEEVAVAIADEARGWQRTWREVRRGDPIVERAAPLADVFRSSAWTWAR